MTPLLVGRYLEPWCLRVRGGTFYPRQGAPFLGTVALLQPVGDSQLEEVEELNEVEEEGDGCDDLGVDGEDGLLSGARHKAVHRVRARVPYTLELGMDDKAIVK